MVFAQAELVTMMAGEEVLEHHFQDKSEYANDRD